LEKNNSVKAVVFRVDSPGGDAMASDLVAEALKKCSKKSGEKLKFMEQLRF
jgi:ClpP class serine protease